MILDDPDGDHQQLEKCRALLQDFYRNDPLTWDELKQMEGEPVWVEQPYQKMWGLNDGTYVDAFGDDCITIKVLHDLCHFEKNLMGTTWQAFRKERE